MPVTDYFLREHVYFCVHGSELVFLDLKEDKYLSMEAESVLPLFANHGRISASEELTKAIDALVRRGLITADRSAGKPLESMAIASPSGDLQDGADVETKVTPRDISRFLLATLVGVWVLKFGSLLRAVERVRHRRADRGAGAARDPSLTRRCVAKFERIRPFIFSARNHCLFESFVLLEFLATYQLHPCWVFGVRTAPFGAHCWVQQMSIVINDSYEHVSGFSKILAA